MCSTDDESGDDQSTKTQDDVDNEVTFEDDPDEEMDAATKRKYKKIEKQVIEPKDEEGIVEKTENCSTDEESDDDQSTKSEDDVDSGVTFDEDSEKDIDTAEIEEEDWIHYIKRSTADAIDKMEHAKIRCWNRTHKK